MFKRRNKLTKRRLDSMTELNQRELSLIQHNIIKGIAKMDIVEKRKRIDLSVNIDGYMTLEDYLKSVIDIQIFFKVLKDMVSTLVNAFDNLFRLDCFVFSFDGIFINQQTKEVMFLYWPVIEGGEVNDLHQLFMRLINEVKIENNSSDELLRVIEYLTQNKTFSLKNFAKVLNSLSNGGALEIDSGILTTNKLVDQKTVESEELVTESKNSFRHVLESEEIVNNDAPESYANCATTVLGGNEISDVRFYLKQSKNGNEFGIKNNSIKIGKIGDIAIEDNTNVSRNHAEIYYEGDKLFIADMGSTNGTRVNGIKISVPTEIKHNDEVHFADELFLVINSEEV